MKPASFSYQDPRTIHELLVLLAEHGLEAKLLAGGQSLIPMMNFRLVRPQYLIDINRVAELAKIEVVDDVLVLGALARQADVEANVHVKRGWPIISKTLELVGHTQTRNRGTIGGSLAQNDPAAELPALMLLLDATVTLRSVRGTRKVEMRNFFRSYLTTAIEPDECLTQIEVPSLPPQTGWAFEEVSRRHGDFAMVAAGALFLPGNQSSAHTARIVISGVVDRPIRIADAEAILATDHKTDRVFAEVARVTMEKLDQPNEDIHAPAWYRRQVAGVLVERVCRTAVDRSGGPT
jgi:carbon-monoxide dehydrogenase medium subunit